MKTKAALAIEAGKPLEIVNVNLDGPKDNEVLVEIMATGVCHTDEFTLSGADPEGIFPAILGHEGAGIVREVGPDVKSLKVGDHVVFGQYGGNTVKIEGDEFLILNESEIYGVVE